MGTRRPESEGPSLDRRDDDVEEAERARAIQIGRNIRASIVLAGRELDDVAADLNISGKTLMRIIRGERDVREREIRRLAEVLKVPEWFLWQGFDTSAARTRDAEIGALRTELDQLTTAALRDLALLKRALNVVG